MAIISIDGLELVNQVKCNELPIKVSSNLTLEPLINYLRLRIDGSPVQEQILNFAYDGTSLTYTVATAADNSGNQLSIQGALSLPDYVALLAEELSRNYDLYLNFRVEYESQGPFWYIKIYPRFSNSFTWTVESTLSNIVVADIISSGGEENPSVALLVEVYDQEEEKYCDPLAHILPIVKENEAVVFNIQPDFDLRYHLPSRDTIGVGGDLISLATDCYTKFKFKVAERLGNPPEVQALDSDGKEYHVLYAGRPTQEEYTKWWTFWQYNFRFLTLQPIEKEITFDQPEWLYWVCRQASEEHSLHVVTTARDGSNTSVTYESFKATIGQVIYIKTGFEQLGLTFDPANPIVSYTVSLRNKHGNTISEQRKYILSTDCTEWERFFLFGNSLGGCDTIRATGKADVNIQYTSQPAERFLTPQIIEDSRGQFFHYGIKKRVGFEARIGYITEAQLLYLQELLLAEEAWMINTNIGEFTPIVINPDNIDFFKDGQDLYTLTFSYQFAFEDCAISKPGI